MGRTPTPDVAGAETVESVFRTHAASLLRYVSRRLSNPAEARDLVQEAYLRLLRVPNFEQIERPDAYVFRIAANLANEALARRRTAPEATLSEPQDEWVTSDGGQFEHTIETRQALLRLETILAGLPPLYRAVLLLRKREGLTHEEIAARLNISTHTVHKYLTRALFKCRAEWAE